MNENILPAILASNVVVMAASLGTAIKYYIACQELHQAVRSAAERDGSQYAQSFQSLLWQEKKLEMEKSLAAHKRAVENLTEQLAALNDRFAGLEQAYHEARHELNDTLVAKAQAEENGKRKRKNG
jgi:uncharacterized coiled-coil protein SlyX